MIKAINEPDVAYCCCIVAGNYIYDQDAKIYKRKGDAIERCERLNLQEEEYKYRVLAASEMTELEEKQANCPFCHEPLKPWGFYDKNSDYIPDLAMIDPVAKQLSIDSDSWDYYNDEPCSDHTSAPIIYCPMCGRKLGEDE